MTKETPKFNPEQIPVAESPADTAESAETLHARIRELEQDNARLAERNRELEELAYKDPLTKLLNRNGLQKELSERHFGRHEISNPHSGSLLILDVDNFKQINDLFGHSVGDEVLQAVASHLKGNTRSTDLVARWGGEEFVVIFEQTDAEGILKKLYKKHDGEQVGRPRFNVTAEIEGQMTNITLSGGVANFVEGEDIRLVVKRADEALYLAKDSGKDRIVSELEISEETKPNV